MKTNSTPAPKRIGVGALAGVLAREPRAVVIDVRAPAEFNLGHIPQARLHPLPDLRPAEVLQQSGASEPLFVICQSGARAAKALERFKEAAFDNCVLVEGGMDAWTQAGLPVLRGKGGGLSLLRQVQLIVGFLSFVGAGLALTVDRRFALIPLVMGCGLLAAGLSGTCGLALLLGGMPWNRTRRHGADVCCT